MLHRLCGPPSIPLSFTLAGILPRRYTYRVCFGTRAYAQTPSAHRLLCGLPGYLNLFAPRTFAPQRQYMARYLPSPSVFFQISTDFTPTPGIPISPPVLKSDSFQRMTGLSPEFLHQTCLTACVPFTPNNSE